jgi:hypothetical protein
MGKWCRRLGLFGLLALAGCASQRAAGPADVSSAPEPAPQRAHPVWDGARNTVLFLAAPWMIMYEQAQHPGEKMFY